MEFIKNILKKYKEIILYLFFGGLTTLINILSYTMLTKLLSVNWQVSNIIAWVLSVLFAYVTNRKFVFESENTDILKETVSFFFFRIVSLGLDMLFMFLLIDVLSSPDIVAKIITQVLVIVLNYLFSKVFVFKK